MKSAARLGESARRTCKASDERGSVTVMRSTVGARPDSAGDP